MKIAIVGWTTEGYAALRYWQTQGAEITVCDPHTEVTIPVGIKKQVGEKYLHNLDRFELVVRASHIHPDVVLAQNPTVANRLTTTTNEFLRVCPTKQIIGVTGTRGKSTTTALIGAMLETAGKQVFVADNHRTQALDILNEITPESWVVMELSSYQLFDVAHSPHIAICLSVVGEYFDWHGTMDRFAAAKENLFAHQTDSDVAIYYAENALSHQIASNSPGDKIAYFDEPGAYIYENKIMIDQTVLCTTSDLQLLGKHNWQNICAAITATWQVVQAPDAIRQVLLRFTGLPHRIEQVREHGGITYYDDSYATIPAFTATALAAVPGKKIVIVGGDDHDLPLDKLMVAFKEHEKDIRLLVLVGASGARLQNELSAAKYKAFRVCPATAMQEIVRFAHAHAQKGDSVLLSPGFSDATIFADADDRGRQFKEAVHAL